MRAERGDPPKVHAHYTSLYLSTHAEIACLPEPRRRQASASVLRKDKEGKSLRIPDQCQECGNLPPVVPHYFSPGSLPRSKDKEGRSLRTQ